MNVFAAAPDSARLRAKLDAMGVGDWAMALRPEALSTLIAEAHRARADAELVEVGAFELEANGQKMRSPMRFLASVGGEALHRIHESEELAAMASELAGCEMEPSEAAYLYFRDGDSIGLHTDIPACELTFLVPLGDAAPPLVVHPELRSADPADLLALARGCEGAPAGGLEIPIPPDGLLALDGQVAPHQTRPVRGTKDAVLATLCYAGRVAA